MSAPVCDEAFSSLLGSKHLDCVRHSQASYVNSKNNLRCLAFVLETAEHFLSAAGSLLKDKGEEFSDLRSMLLQVDKSLGMSQFLLLGTVANFTLAKRQEILEKSTVSEALQQRLVSSPLSKDKLFSVSLEQLQAPPPVVKVDVKVTDGKRFVKTYSVYEEDQLFSRPNYSSGKKAKVVKGKKQDKWVLSILRRGLELQFLEQPPLSPVPINLSVSDKGFSKESVVTRRSEHSYSEGCVGGGKSSFSSRVLFPAVLGSQEERENETGSRSFCSQSVSGGPTFQNGDQQVYQVDNSFRNLDNLSRFDGRLFSHPNFSQVSSFPETGLGRQGLQFQGYAFWPGYCTPSFYQDFSDGGVLSSYSGSTHSLLPRRFSHQESLPISFGGTHQFVYPFTPETGFFDFMGKIRDNSQSEFQFPGRTFSDRFGSSASSRREGSQARQFLSWTSFHTRLHIRPIQWYLSEFWHPISQLWEAPVPILPRLLPHLQWWLQEKHLRKGVLLDPPDPSLTLFTDASLMGWGAYLEGRTASGLWSGAQLEEHINLARDESCVSFSPSVSGCDSGSVTTGCHGQLHSSGLSSESRRDPFLFSVSSEQGNSSSVSHARYNSVSVPGSQNLLADALSRSRVPVNTEWEIHPSVFQEIILRWDRPHIDLFATSLNHKLETYVSPIPDEKAWAVDAMTLSWKGMFSYMFPPFRLLLQRSCTKDSEGSLQDHSYCSGLAKTVLVPRTTTSVLCEAFVLPLREDLLSQFKGRKLHQGLENLHLHAWLLSGIPSEREAFLREQPSVSQDQSDNLQEQFMTPNGQFSVLGVIRKQIDPLTVTVQQLADFFFYLCEEKGYSPSTIKGYRSAIARTISLSGGSDFGDNEFLSLLIKKNFCLNRPRQRRLVPSWDLGLVLKVLQFPPFEPLHSASLKFLSYKCCFLIALATGRRRSEIHALSISESCLRFAADKSSVTLLTDPSFLAKNQLPDKGSGLITIPALPPTADNQVLCPVRSLLWYLAFFSIIKICWFF
ncbi:Hypothetical predicted protein [Mytilus galloprovincialis]|uniref:Core-binding (CB) domain-containing protein n=1 Tax=Mytilus galloprovincialis TaxID=29158 RepID=A0A8B6DLA1_MYTGA|nr:Hypothetical predicted protein [Mytilus galloprovincialis]